jgi:hypothetical protein
VFGPLDDLLSRLQQRAILLTPHQTEPDTEWQAIIDDEICSLIHGVFNMGFLAVRPENEGRRFLDWWAQRLLHFCYDDKAGGLFTDQRWVDLAPCFFTDLEVVRDPQYNVATWNLSHRRATGTAPYDIIIEGRPLGFYHFSGLDSGAQEIMLERYGAHSPVLFELRKWYLDECDRLGQARYARRACVYGRYSNGTPVALAERLLYRHRQDLQAAFPDPFDARDPGASYLHWYRANVEAPARSEAARQALVERLAAEAALQEPRLRQLEAALADRDQRLQQLEADARARELLLQTALKDVQDLTRNRAALERSRAFRLVHAMARTKRSLARTFVKLRPTG